MGQDSGCHVTACTSKLRWCPRVDVVCLNHATCHLLQQVNMVDSTSHVTDEELDKVARSKFYLISTSCKSTNIQPYSVLVLNNNSPTV